MKSYVKSTFAFSVLLVLQIHTTVAQKIKYENAPMNTAPNTTRAMFTPEFWISNTKGNVDKVILSQEKIAYLNRETSRMTEKVKKLKDINGESYSLDSIIRYNDMTGVQYNIENPLSLNTFSGDSLRARLRDHRTYFDSDTYYDGRRMKFDGVKKSELYEKTGAGSIPDTITPRYGIVSTHTMCRVLPTYEAAFGGAGDWYTRGLQGASVDVATPVAVLHESKEKDWYYIRSENAFGWVKATNIAIGSKKEIGDYYADENIIVALNHKVSVYSNEKFDSYIIDLFMGSTLKLTGSSSRGYHVILPFRMPDGSLDFIDGWVKPDAQVSVGFQTFTQKNMFKTLFSLIGRPYYWCDANHEWNCCGFVRVVLRTFGIKTGNWPTFEMHYTDNTIAFPPDTPLEEKYELLRSCEPGITLAGSDGHMQVFLGEVDGLLFVIHMGGYDYTTDDGTEMMVRRVNVNEVGIKSLYSSKDWTKFCPLKP